MKEKIKYGSAILLLIIGNLFVYYFIVIQEYTKILFYNNGIAYFFIAIAINTFFYIYYLFFNARQQLKILSNDIIIKENRFEKFQKNFQQKLDKEKVITRAKDKMIYEHSKLITTYKEEKKVFQLKHLLYNLFDLTDSVHSTGNIQIGYDLKKDISVYSYKQNLIQVLLNIFNTSKEIFKQKEIKKRIILIEIDADKKNFYINIKDSTGGMEKGIIDRVFEPYFTTKHRLQGVGLGLYLSYVIVTQKLGGEISVENTTFTSELYDGELYGANFLIKVPVIE